MNRRIHLALLHILALACAVGWAFASHKYDCFNVGPCRGNVNFWITLGDVAFYSFLGSWVALLACTALWSRQFKGAGASALVWFIAAMLPPVAMLTSSWLFNLGIAGARV